MPPKRGTPRLWSFGIWCAWSASAAGATFTVTNSADSGDGTLRWAIVNANLTSGLDNIYFNISPPGVHVISLSTELPVIDHPVIIDGRTQPGYSTPAIELDGSSVYCTNGLVIHASGCAVYGLAIHDFKGCPLNPRAQIHVLECNDTIIQDNWLGLTAGGGASTLDPITLGSMGIWVLNAAGTQIGGAGFGRNVISGNGTDGVRVEGAGSVNTVIAGNFVGTDTTGASAKHNNWDGIRIAENSSDTQVGGPGIEWRNVISGNYSNGVDLITSDNNVVAGNYIGTDLAGSTAVANSLAGVRIFDGSDNVIGGSSDTERNLISANDGSGIRLDSDKGSTTRNLVDGNYIGTDAAGTAPLGNHLDGVMLTGANTTANLIVSTNGQINLIRFNSRVGVNVLSHGNVVLANVIQDNQQEGINLQGNNNAALGNSIVDNGADGIRVSGSGNRLNSNTIQHNGRSGVTVVSASAQANLITRNSISAHPRLGIDLGNDLVTVNDTGDGDAGPNALQNFPNISHVVGDSSNVAVEGTLNSTPSSSFVLEFIWNEVCNPNNHGEGKFFIGQLAVVTDSSGNASFSTHFPVGVPASLPVTATATSALGNTSEFSACRPVIGPPTLAITLAADVVTLTWPVAAGDFVLQSSPMSMPPVWTDVSAPVTVFGGVNIVTQPATPAFYRLRHR